jgi:hypothetical protein
MAERKLSAKELKALIASLLNKKAKLTDETEKAILKKQIDKLNAQLKEINKKASEEKNLSAVEKAQKELERLNKLDPSTPGVAPSIAAQKKIIADATKKGLPKPTGATSNDSDGDGIPNAVDPEPNTPSGKSDKPAPTPIKTPIKTPVKKEVKTEVKTVTPAAPVEDREATALGTANADFTLPKTIFDNEPSLKLLLEKYVKTPGMTIAAFRKELQDNLWFKQNSEEIKKRYVQYYNFRDLQKSGRAQGTTNYEMQIAKIEENLKRRAIQIGSAAANDPAALRKAAENLYITDSSEDENFIDSFLAASIKTVAGKIGGQVTEGYSGQALSNYKLLVEAARDNGFQLSDIIPGGATEQQVLQGIATGSIDINRVIADARKLAAQGQPQYVRDLLAQGLTLKQILTPYRTTMANVLEIQNPEEINLNDPLLRSAITDKGDMNMYEFKKALRRDNRWQYTEQARADVSTATLGVLRDFGFQG